MLGTQPLVNYDTIDDVLIYNFRVIKVNVLLVFIWFDIDVLTSNKRKNINKSVTFSTSSYGRL